jgi:two-component system nitrogen regulation sensor histidine kinase NtrY
MKEEDLAELCRQAVFLQNEAHPSIVFQLKTLEQSVMLQCDAQQVGQMLTNLLQNAINALNDYDLYDKESLDYCPSPLISLTLEVGDKNVYLIVEDNGPGFPQEGRERLTEPYFTTHAKGTGLGLAIIAKIVEDHQGKLELGDSALGGAKVLIELPVSLEDR